MKKVMLVIAIIAVAVVVSGMRKPSKAEVYREYVVSSGDTLWEIAEEITPEERDLRHTILDIEKKNNIEDGMIYVGQHIEIPVYEEK